MISRVSSKNKGKQVKRENSVKNKDHLTEKKKQQQQQQQQRNRQQHRRESNPVYLHSGTRDLKN